MTKVYLVNAIFEEPNGYKTFAVMEVFTNRRLAKNYLEYNKLRYEKEKPDWMLKGETVTLTIETRTVCHLDWRTDLVELQKKYLPY